MNQRTILVLGASGLIGRALIVASLVAFWLVSGSIALFASYRAAAGILTAHSFPPALVDPITIGTSLMDMSIGALVKTGPAVVLMLVTLMMMDNR